MIDLPAAPYVNHPLVGSKRVHVHILEIYRM